MKWLACWTIDLKVGDSRPSLSYGVVLLDKNLYSTVFFHPGV